MITCPNHLAFIQDNYLICIFCSTQSMCYYYDSLTFIELIQILYDGTFIACIQRICRFIKEDELRILIHSASNQNTLLLPLAQTHAVPANIGIELQRKSHDKALDVGDFSSLFKSFLINLTIIYRNIPCNRLREDDTILHDDTALPPPPFLVVFSYVMTCNRYLTTHDRIIPQHEFYQCSLSTSRRTNDGCYFSLWDMNVHAPNGLG